MHEPLAPEVRAALAQCRWMIRKGSKSFSLAARLFDPATRDAAFFLYGWCRYCDDQVDGLGAAANPAVLHNRLAALRARTAAAFASEPVEEPVFIALQYIARRYAIPSHYATELIEGMAMDVNATRYRSFAELLLYCYRVAGTVGLMMAHVMGVRDEQALRHAAHLGIAMQLTNIARDVIEDAALSRVYLPLSWLDEAGINAAEIAAAKNRPALARIVARLLAEADRYYRSGDQGLWHLSFRSACAVAAVPVWTTWGAVPSSLNGSLAGGPAAALPTATSARPSSFSTSETNPRSISSWAKVIKSTSSPNLRRTSTHCGRVNRP